MTTNQSVTKTADVKLIKIAPAAQAAAAHPIAPRLVPLAELHFGHELKSGGINARVADRGEVNGLARSIKEMGLIVPLAVRNEKSILYVIDGNRRLAALHALYPKGTDRDLANVPIFEPALAGGHGLELSMIANSERLDLHPVDRFEVFQRLIAEGATVDELAARYMLKVPQVRQALALVAIAPEILKAWRAGEIDGEAAEVYALTKDLEHQRRIFKKLGKNNSGNAWSIRHELAGHTNISTLLRFVGAEAYEAAGHQINESLFKDEDDRRGGVTVTNVPALMAMAATKIEAECKRLIEDGWGWAIAHDAAPKDIHAWRQLPGGTPTKELKAAAGCTVQMGHDGKLEIRRGYIKPGTSVKIPKSAEQKKAQAKAAKTKAESGGLSQSLCLRLSTAITKAAAYTLALQPALALRATIAGMACAGSPIVIDLRGEDADQIETRHDNEFAKYFGMLQAEKLDEVLEALAPWAAASLDMITHSPDSMPLRGERDEGASVALLNAMKPGLLNRALREAFDRKDYFASVPAALIKAAMTDCGLSVPANAKRSQLAALALGNVHNDWLPIEMRTKHYDGPSVNARARAAAKPAPKKGAGKTKPKKKGR